LRGVSRTIHYMGTETPLWDMQRNRTEGQINRMMYTAQRIRRWVGGAVIAGALAATMTLVAPAAQAQQSAVTTATRTVAAPLAQQPLPSSVLLFPAVISAEGGAVAPANAMTKQRQEIITDEVRRALEKGGIGVVVYSERLPSIQRAVQEGGTLKPEEAAKGPGDDQRLQQKFADIVGAKEYITVMVDNYQYDPTTKRATFNLSMSRNGADGSSLASSAEKAVGDAPSTTAASLQEGSAVARATSVVAQKSVIAVYPQSAAVYNPPPAPDKKAKRSNRLAIIIPVAALAAFLLVPR
jgi:hypothetical protein